jgi:hypothetical protein
MLNQETFYIRWVLYLSSFVIAFGLAKATRNQDYILAWMIGLIGFVNVEVMYFLSRTPATAPTIQRLYRQCYWTCSHPWCLKATQLRGERYFLLPGDGGFAPTGTPQSLSSSRGDGGFAPTGSPQSLSSSRGDGTPQCMLSLWGVLQFLLFALIGFVAPSIFPAIVIVSLIYEMAEYFLYQCHDALDILLNISGYLFGMLIRRSAFKNE